jgi:hypothetical protein
MRGFRNTVTAIFAMGPTLLHYAEPNPPGYGNCKVPLLIALDSIVDGAGILRFLSPKAEKVKREETMGSRYERK